MEAIIEKLKKIKRLADQGFQGEAESAKDKLSILLKKHNLTLEDISDDLKETYIFTYKYKREKDLMLQCISKITDNPKLSYSYKKDKRKEFWVDLTKWQYAEAQDMIKFHVSQFRKEMEKKMDAIYSAYLSMHSIFADSTSKEGGKKLTQEEIEEILNAYSGLSNTKSYNKKLTE